MALIVLLKCKDSAFLICGQISLLQKELFDLHENFGNFRKKFNNENEIQFIRNQINNFSFKTYIKHCVDPNNIDIHTFRNELAIIIKFFQKRLTKGVLIYKNKNYQQRKKNSDIYFKLLKLEYGTIHTVFQELKIRYPNEYTNNLNKELNNLEIKKEKIVLQAIRV